MPILILLLFYGQDPPGKETDLAWSNTDLKIKPR